jgi:cellulose synthase/poly-beta-1,6-N-acetylglucosamine synthase-like glycosyltransferase
MRSDHTLILALRTLVILTAALISYFLIKTAPVYASHWSAILYNTGAISVPPWISLTLLVLYGYFILTVVLPFLLTLGWMTLEDTHKQAVSSVPFVSIVIPAYNEEASILRSLEALGRMDYPSFEVIIVNDGSTDFTFSIIEGARVKCIHLKKNQGKSAALNAGIAQAHGEIIVFSDSDSWLHPMTLRYLIQGFSSPSVGAVSGTVEINPRNNMLRRWQVIEYTFGQFFVKKAQLGSGNGVAICPGPVCAFRKDLLIKIGGFSNRTITEDFDATLTIINLGYQVNYAPQAIAYTEAPQTWRQLKQQRLRWFRGHIQTFALHRTLFFNPRTGSLGTYWLPVYYFFLGYICGAIEFLLIPLIILLFILSGHAMAMLQAASIYALFAFLFVTIGYSIVLIQTKQLNRPLMVALVTIYPYLFYLNWLRLLAFFNELRGKAATWSG